MAKMSKFNITRTAGPIDSVGCSIEPGIPFFLFVFHKNFSPSDHQKWLKLTISVKKRQKWLHSVFWNIWSNKVGFKFLLPNWNFFWLQIIEFYTFKKVNRQKLPGSAWKSRLKIAKIAKMAISISREPLVQ